MRDDFSQATKDLLANRVASLAVALANGGVVEKNEAGKYYIWIDRK